MKIRKDFYLIIEKASSRPKYIDITCKSLIDNSKVCFTINKGTMIYNNLIKAKVGTRIFVNGIPNNDQFLESVKIGNKKNYDKMEEEFPEYFI